MRVILYLLCACAGLLVSGCALIDDDAKKKEGICIHGMLVVPKANDCSACVGGSPACDTKYYTYCSDEKKSDDCINQSAACNVSMATKAEYDDTITFYDDGKRCDTSGYTVTCSNPKYKASDVAYCPP